MNHRRQFVKTLKLWATAGKGMSIPRRIWASAAGVAMLKLDLGNPRLTPNGLSPTQSPQLASTRLTRYAAWEREDR